MRAIENLSRTACATATGERGQPALFPMVESDLVSTVEHYLVASPFMAGFMNTKLHANDGRLVLYAVILFIFGVTMVLLNCFFSAIQPRFTLPMMELLILSMMILLGVIFRECKISWGRAASEPTFSPTSAGSKPV